MLLFGSFLTIIAYTMDKLPVSPLVKLPQIVRGPDAVTTADLNRENVVSWGLQVMGMAGDPQLSADDKKFAQRVALLMLQKMVPNASAIDQIDRSEDRRLFRELAGMSKDDLLRMSGITPAELVKAVKERGPCVIDVTASSGVHSASTTAEVAQAQQMARARPMDSATYVPAEETF